MSKKSIRIPKYNLKEELINSISHGVGGGLAIAGLVLMMIKANRPLEYVTTEVVARHDLGPRGGAPAGTGTD